MQLRNISIMYYRPFIHGSIFTVQKKRLVVCRCYTLLCIVYTVSAACRVEVTSSPPPPPIISLAGIWNLKKKGFFTFFAAYDENIETAAYWLL